MKSTFTFLSTLVFIEVDSSRSIHLKHMGAEIEERPLYTNRNCWSVIVQFSGIINRKYEWLMFWQEMTQQQ